MVHGKAYVTITDRGVEGCRYSVCTGFGCRVSAHTAEIPAGCFFVVVVRAVDGYILRSSDAGTELMIVRNFELVQPFAVLAEIDCKGHGIRSAVV